MPAAKEESERLIYKAWPNWVGSVITLVALSVALIHPRNHLGQMFAGIGCLVVIAAMIAFATKRLSTILYICGFTMFAVQIATTHW